MPTIVGIDSFQHRIIPTAINSVVGWYSAVNNGGTTPNHGGAGVTFDTGIKRTSDHACSLKIVGDGVSSTNVRFTVATKVIVGSVYFRMPSIPASTAKIIGMNLSAGTQSIQITTSGFIQAKVGSGTAQSGAVNYADDAWHRVDWNANTETGTATLDVTVDGTETLTQATLALATANMTSVNVGDNNITAMTCYYQDLVWSNTTADHPLGDHICLLSPIASTGTHNKGAGTWSDEAGNTTDAELLNSVDDAWDGTTPELSQTGEDHVKKSAGVTGTEYLEFGIAAISQTGAVWGGQLGTLIAALDSTTANNQETRLVDSGGSTLGTTGAAIDASISSTAYSAYRSRITAAPSGGWSKANLEACMIRWGFTTDVTPNPVMNTSCVEYACAWAAAAGASWAGLHTPDRSIYTAL